MKMKYYKKGWGIILILFLEIFLSIKLSSGGPVSEKKKTDPLIHGVTIVSLDAPMRATIGRKVNIEVVVGNERAAKVTTILTVTCPTTKQQIGRDAVTLNSLTSQKIVYSV